MITFSQALALKPGDILLDSRNRRWKVNGKVQTWKKNPNRIRVPLKHGLRDYDAITETDFDSDSECALLSLERESEMLSGPEGRPANRDYWGD